MPLNCFFGVELVPGKDDVVPPLPPQSILVISQACVTYESFRESLKITSGSSSSTTAANGGGKVLDDRITICVREIHSTTSLAVATLHPSAGVLHQTLNLCFSSALAFSVVAPTAAGAALRVHLTGYYEARDPEEEESDDSEDGDDDDEDDGASEEAHEQRAGAASTRFPSGRQDGSRKRGRQ